MREGQESREKQEEPGIKEAYEERLRDLCLKFHHRREIFIFYNLKLTTIVNSSLKRIEGLNV